MCDQDRLFRENLQVTTSELLLTKPVSRAGLFLLVILRLTSGGRRIKVAQVVTDRHPYFKVTELLTERKSSEVRRVVPRKGTVKRVAAGKMSAPLTQ